MRQKKRGRKDATGAENEFQKSSQKENRNCGKPQTKRNKVVKQSRNGEKLKPETQMLSLDGPGHRLHAGGWCDDSHMISNFGEKSAGRWRGNLTQGGQVAAKSQTARAQTGRAKRGAIGQGKLEQTLFAAKTFFFSFFFFFFFNFVCGQYSP